MRCCLLRCDRKFKGLTLTFMHALIVVVVAGLIVGGVALLLTEKKLPLLPMPSRKAKPPERSLQEEAVLMELAQRAVSRYGLQVALDHWTSVRRLDIRQRVLRYYNRLRMPVPGDWGEPNAVGRVRPTD